MIRICTTLTSDTPHLPDLAPLVGRRVSIVVQEEPASAAEAGPTPAVLAIRHAAAARLRASTYDFDTLAGQDAIDLADQERRPE